MTIDRGNTRRGLGKAAAAALALTAAACAALPGGAFAQVAGSEVKGAKLGFTRAAVLELVFARHTKPAALATRG